MIVLEPLPADLDLDQAADNWGSAYGDRDGLRAIIGELFRTQRPQPWGNYLARRDGEAVGLCAFKAPPADGAVEIAYGTFPPVQRQGVAQAMAAGLIEIARGRGVVLVVAHTLPEPNTSNRILARLGFSFAGDAEDPDDGHVWLWQRPA
ncbi:GNAT family N-acetyltransferase [Glacieibacterium frigidum]|uniref:GNAT family N-acetyltransferase n=1 Tax=Glacieibacterium frigidum TaxID=2593303 RepID=UPI00163D6AAE|nr:GNAT family N-acetyltransferase [Glacieibacterium frigidum]